MRPWKPFSGIGASGRGRGAFAGRSGFFFRMGSFMFLWVRRRGAATNCLTIPDSEYIYHEK